MNKKHVSFGCILLVMVLLVLVLSSSCAESAPTAAPGPTPAQEAPKAPVQEVLNFKCVSCFPAKGGTYYFDNKYFPELERLSNGRLVVDIYPVGELCQANEMIKYVGTGAVEMGGPSVGANHFGDVKVGLLELGTDCGWSTQQEAYENIYEFKNGELFKIYQEAYEEKNIKLLVDFPLGTNWMISKFPLEKWEDTNGKRFGGLGKSGLASFMNKEYGCSVVAVSPRELYLALQRGTIDFINYQGGCIEDYKFYEVVEYLTPEIEPGNWNDIYINLDTWNSLPDDLKGTIQEWCNWLITDYPIRYAEAEAAVFNKEAELGVEIVDIPDSELKKYRDWIISNALPGIAHIDDYCARAAANIMEFHKSKGRDIIAK